MRKLQNQQKVIEECEPLRCAGEEDGEAHPKEASGTHTSLLSMLSTAGEAVAEQHVAGPYWLNLWGENELVGSCAGENEELDLMFWAGLLQSCCGSC